MLEDTNSLDGAHIEYKKNNLPTGKWQAGPPSADGSESDFESSGRWFEPRSGHILSLRFGHEKTISTIIHILPLIQEGQLSVTGERMGTKTGKLPSRLIQKQCG